MASSESDNAVRWKGRPGAYEAYYVILHDAPSRTAWWLRYTLMAPFRARPPTQPRSASEREGRWAERGEPVVELWGNFFDGKSGRTVALKQAAPASKAELSASPFRFALGDSELTHRSARGRVKSAEGEMEWDLKWEPAPRSFRHLPGLFYSLPLPVARVASPNPAVSISGRAVVNGTRYEFQGAPGHQTHHWGRRHAPGWAWGHCGAFKEDPEFVFEGFSVKPRTGSDRLLTIVHFGRPGHAFTFNRLSDLRKTESRWELGRWTFAAERGETRFEGELTGEPAQMVQLEYIDPDDSRLYCANTELADMRLKVLRRDGG
ncbi:MAG: tocopherol cyclase family protein, partial [Halobacteria archaeon]